MSLRDHLPKRHTHHLRALAANLALLGVIALCGTAGSCQDDGGSSGGTGGGGGGKKTLPYATPHGDNLSGLVIGRDIPSGTYVTTVPGNKSNSCHFDVTLPGGRRFPDQWASGGQTIEVELPAGGGLFSSIGCGYWRPKS